MFAGVVGNTSVCDALQTLASRPEGFGGIVFDDRDFWREGAVALLQQQQWHAPNQKPGIFYHQATDIRIVGWLRIDNRAELLNQLHEEAHLQNAVDAALILAAYQRWGEALCEHLVGDFSFAIHDQRAGRWLLARDHLGVRPLYYVQSLGGLIFASSLDGLFELLGNRLSLNSRWLAHYVAGCSPDWEHTVYREINKLPPAEILQYSQGRLHRHQYFKFSTDSGDGFVSEQDRVSAYRELLEKTIACRIQTTDATPIASETSGGIDSSSITALAAWVMDDPGRYLHALGFAGHEQEPEAIMAVSQFVPVASTQVITNAQCLRSAKEHDKVIRALGAPLEHGNASAHIPIYHLARNMGANVLLSGFGGDEFVTNNGNMSRDELWNQGHYLTWASRFRGNWITRPLRWLNWGRYKFIDRQSIVAQSLSQLAEARINGSILSDRAMEQYDVAGHLRKTHRYDTGCRTQNQFCIEDRWSAAMTARLENCTLAAAVYGLDYRWPLLDVRLLQFFLAAPASAKIGPNGIGRWLHRRAIADSLPDWVVWKSKAMGRPVPLPDRWQKKQIPVAPTGKSLPELTHYADLAAPLQAIIDQKKFIQFREQMQAIPVDKPRNLHLVARVARMQYRHLTALNQWLYRGKVC